MTNRDIAMRTLWGAGRYLEAHYQTCRSMSEIKAVEEAVLILANAYMKVLGERQCSKAETDSTLTTA